MFLKVLIVILYSASLSESDIKKHLPHRHRHHHDVFRGNGKKAEYQHTLNFLGHDNRTQKPSILNNFNEILPNSEEETLYPSSRKQTTINYQTASSSFLVTTPQGVYKTRRSVRLLTPPPILDGIFIIIPEELPLQCRDSSWSNTKMLNTIAKLNLYQQCLEINWIRVDNIIIEEAWTISGPKLCGQFSNERQRLFNCKYFPLEKLPEGQTSNSFIESATRSNNEHLETHNFLYFAPAFDIFRNEEMPLYSQQEINAKFAANMCKSSSSLMILTHGFRQSGKAQWLKEMKNEILRLNQNISVFIICWEKDANLMFYEYERAAASTETVGKFIASIVKRIKSFDDCKGLEIWGVGHSLGAHVLGCAGKEAKGFFKRITGLDPAGPLFGTLFNTSCLKKGDAEFVDVIHTDAYYKHIFSKAPPCIPENVGSNLECQTDRRDTFNFAEGGHYGYREELGDIDFYPNFGFNQPGNFWNPFATNSHSMAYEYFTWSIAHPGKMLTNLKIIDMSANTGFDEATTAKQNWRRTDYVVEMGFYSSPIARGSFLLTTEKEAPWVRVAPKLVGAESFKCKNNIQVLASSVSALFIKRLDVQYIIDDERAVTLYASYFSNADSSTKMTIHHISINNIFDQDNNFLSKFCYKKKLQQDLYAGILPDVTEAYRVAGMFVDKKRKEIVACQIVPNGVFQQYRESYATQFYFNAVPLAQEICDGIFKITKTFISKHAPLGSRVITLTMDSLYNERSGIARREDEELNTRIVYPSTIQFIVMGKNCTTTFGVDTRLEKFPYSSYCPELLINDIKKNSNGFGIVTCSAGIPDDKLKKILKVDAAVFHKINESRFNVSCF